MKTKLHETTLSSEHVYKGKVFDIFKDEVELSDGKKSLREVVRHPGGVVIVAQKDDDTILMVKQFRYPVGEPSLELPAGKLDKGEEPDSASRRELEEETGYAAKNWNYLGYIYTTPGFCDEKLHLYYASNLVFVGQKPDDGEILECFEYKKDKIFEMIKNGEINDSKTICALTRAFKI